jgi:hypothetical protein
MPVISGLAGIWERRAKVGRRWGESTVQEGRPEGRLAGAPSKVDGEPCGDPVLTGVRQGASRVRCLPQLDGSRVVQRWVGSTCHTG